MEARKGLVVLAVSVHTEIGGFVVKTRARGCVSGKGTKGVLRNVVGEPYTSGLGKGSCSLSSMDR